MILCYPKDYATALKILYGKDFDVFGFIEKSDLSEEYKVFLKEAIESNPVSIL